MNTRPTFDPAKLFVTHPVLRTARLELREMVSTDAEGLFDVYGDAFVGRFNRWTALENVQGAAEKIAVFRQHFKERKRIRWGITPRETGRVIGDVAVVSFDHRAHRAELGFNLAQAHWRKGIMGEAVRAVIRHGFHEWGLNRFEAIVLPENAPCVALLQKLGFQRDGRIREGGKIDGKFVDVELWGLLRSEFSEQG